MKVLLIQDVKSLGKAGEIVDVKDGYGHNFLIAKGMAKLATNEVINKYKADLKKAAQIKELEIAELKLLARRIEEVTLTLSKKTGSGDALFGSITKEEIAQELESAHKIFIDKKAIELQSIKNIGEYDVTIKLGSAISATLKLKVEKESK